MASRKTKRRLVAQNFSGSLASIFVQLDRRRQDEKMQRDTATDIYLELVEKQRHYYKTVKDFQDVSGIG